MVMVTVVEATKPEVKGTVSMRTLVNNIGVHRSSQLRDNAALPRWRQLSARKNHPGESSVCPLLSCFNVPTHSTC